MTVMKPAMATRVVVANAGREFGGTNKKIAGLGMPCTAYDEEITGFGWFGALGGAKGRKKAAPPKKAAREEVDPVTGKRLFGGTNKNMAGIGKPCTEYDQPV